MYNTIVVHPNSSLKKKTDGNYECPDVYDYAGGAMWGNKSDNICAIYRPLYTTDKANTETEFRSQKIKKQKLVGTPGTAILRYDRITGRYTEERGSSFVSPLP